MDLFEEKVEELNKHLACENQNWIFGAGISYEANIPLMKTLTKRVENLLPEGVLKEMYNNITDDLPDDYHIEHVLSHIGDFITLSERSKHSSVELKNKTYSTEELVSLHFELVSQIGITIRYGYTEAANGIPERIGSIENPIVDIKNHRNFVKALVSSKANLLPRSSISFFTTNYDTLMEDALALEKFNVNDGFNGAAIGFWDPEVSFNTSPGINIIKLHGSVDWIKDTKDGMIRNRYGVNYLDHSSCVIIYPQATKYIETQKDPFAALFTKFREQLHSPLEHVTIFAGYSFGDYHINSEIEIALKSIGNKTTLIVFIDDINEVLSTWLKEQTIANKIFIATKKGIYHGSDTLIYKREEDTLNWWKFSELINFLKDGEPL
ncbi:SIR2 family protein [Candidatus Contubernalis alkaliaceticus]|uniref:SIR2 family protein n=1 Tax=Candidatus Contubernalis alkaliaceticus TaxID=338645 RepID=UPI001F4BD5C5|nr:SIR2 family protein [Candidatus Contubernalis alkalaceticus]UNC91295.1 SIR2 family protein [Candidatus Contubernalis alkalaceticus]